MKKFYKVLPWLVSLTLVIIMFNLRSCDSITDNVISNKTIDKIQDSIIVYKEKIVIQKEEVIVYKTIVKDHLVYRDSFITVYENNPTLENCDTALQVSIAHSDTLEVLVSELDILVAHQSTAIELHEYKDIEQDKLLSKEHKRKKFWRSAFIAAAGVVGWLSLK